jgi:hypothetical protein
MDTYLRYTVYLNIIVLAGREVKKYGIIIKDAHNKRCIHDAVSAHEACCLVSKPTCWCFE